jgi:hypothetical protein
LSLSSSGGVTTDYGKKMTLEKGRTPSPARPPPDNRRMQPVQMRAVASFGGDPTQIEVILPPGDPQVMLADVATKPNFQLFGTGFLYWYPDDDLAKRPAQPANTLIEIGVP